MRLMLPSLVITAALLGVVGCTNTSWRNHIPLATPLQPALQQEVVLARIGQLLSSRILTSDEQAQLLYEQGVLYDSLGLRALARNSFAMALNIRPDMPEAFNYLGIYFTQARDFDAAYEAFDSALELDPTYNNAYLNRGIAFYYGDRYRLSQDDLLAFYKDDPNDPYRVLWLYLTEKKLNAGTAKQLLQQRYHHAKVEQWGWNIVRFYLGDINQLTLMASANKNATNNTMLAEHLSELDFYLGKYYLSLGDKNDAAALFKLTVANNVHNFIEHRCALLELALLGQEQDDLSESDL